MASTQLGNSSKQQCRSKKLKERFPVGHAYESSKYQGKLNFKDDPSCNSGPYKASLDHNQQGVKGKKTKDDELVKYMSNLPDYLECEESGENSRGKALNFGVLDWSRLEEWKHNKESIPAKCGIEAASSSGSTLSSVTPTTSASIFREVSRDSLCKKHSRNLNYTSSHKHHRSQSVQTSYLNTRHYGESETTSSSTLDAHNKDSKNYKCQEDGKREISNQKVASRMGNSSSNLRNHGYLPSLKDDGTNGWECESKMFEELRVTDNNKKPSNRRITFDMVSSPSKLRCNDISSSSREKLFAANQETSKMVQKPRGLTNVQRSTEQKNIVLLLPKKYALGSYLEEAPPSTDESSMESKRSSFSDDFAHQEVGSTEFCSQIPQSCPLTFSVENDSEACMIAQDDKLSFDASKSSTHLGKTANLSDEEAKSTKTLDQDMAKTVSRKSENPLPNRRFSLGFNRFSRSSSFKDGPVVPQLSPSASIKSGPVKFEGSACMDDLSREKATGHNRARSSPLRRILDPLLKSKGLNSSGHNKTVLPSKGGASTSFSVKSNTTDDLLQNGKQDAVMMQALVQFTVRNGVPLFQFVVDNNSSILAATKKNLTLLGKDDSGEHYTFYSVNEVKKKSGSWRSHGSKDKHCGFVYNIVGQMKLDSSDIPPWTELDNHKQHMVKESILFGVESGNEEHTPSKFIKTTELAAVVVKLQCDNWEGVLEKSFPRYPVENVNFHSLGEIEEKSSTTVILPGGVHSSPNKILPSPLIDRWRSGGSCDCGGWDVGCKLRVLSNRNQYQYHSTMKLEKAHLNPNSFELFVQEGSQMSLPVFTLVPLKNGIYTVQFDSSISMLQAFFTCVTIITCQKVGTPDEAKELQMPTLKGNDKINKNPKITVPVKFASNPPVSPVGRV